MVVGCEMSREMSEGTCNSAEQTNFSIRFGSIIAIPISLFNKPALSQKMIFTNKLVRFSFNIDLLKQNSKLQSIAPRNIHQLY